MPNVLNHPADDPRLLLSEPFRAVHFVYGLYHPEVRPLPGAALIGALRALGYGDEAARGIVLRLRRAGFLRSTRVGRVALYDLDARSRGMIDEVSRRASLPAPEWDGTFVTLLVSIPPRARAFRELFRRHAAYAGLGNPLPGLYVGTDRAAVADLDDVLRRAPEGTSSVTGELRVDLDGARVLAAQAWDLEAVERRLVHEAERLEASVRTASEPRDGAGALAFLWLSIGPFFELLSERRSLPTALLPDDWPLARAHAAFIALAMVAAGPARQYVDELAGSASTGR